MEENSFAGFGPGSSVLIETDDKIMAGVVLAIDPFGVLLSVTHKLDVLGLATEADRREIADIVGCMSGKELRRYALSSGIGFWRCVRLSDADLAAAVVEAAVQEHDAIHARRGLRVLSKPIKSWYSMDRIESMEDVEDRVTDSELMDLDWPTPEVAVDKSEEG